MEGREPEAAHSIKSRKLISMKYRSRGKLSRTRLNAGLCEPEMFQFSKKGPSRQVKLIGSFRLAPLVVFSCL